MAWDFSTPAPLQQRLDWAAAFVRDEVQLLDHIIPNAQDPNDPVRAELIPPLQAEVRRQGMWAVHLSEGSDGDRHVDQVGFILLNEILGRSKCAPTIFGCQAPDAGNMEVLRQFGTVDQRAEFLEPLLAGETTSCFSVTEPTGGADPTAYRTRAARHEGGWRLTGEKWFSSGLTYAAFALVVAVTDPDAPRHQRLTMFIVPTDLPGIRVIRTVASGLGSEGPIHAYVAYEGVPLRDEHVLGEVGGGFAIMQQRLGRARLALAGRALGQMNLAFEMLRDRAVSRNVGGSALADRQLVQEMVADCWTDIEQFRLLLMRTAWRIDNATGPTDARGDIAAVKSLMPGVMHRIAKRAAQVHGSLGVSSEMPFVGMVAHALSLGVADGPTEVHKITVAREAMRSSSPTSDLFPARHLPALIDAAQVRYRDVLERHGRA